MTLTSFSVFRVVRFLYDDLDFLDSVDPDDLYDAVDELLDLDLDDDDVSARFDRFKSVHVVFFGNAQTFALTRIFFLKQDLTQLCVAQQQTVFKQDLYVSLSCVCPACVLQTHNEL